jgi:hypothetical protein
MYECNDAFIGTNIMQHGAILWEDDLTIVEF